MGSPSSAPTSVKPGSSGGKSNTNDVAKFSTPVCRASAAAAGSLAGPSSSASPAAAVPPKLRSVPASTAKSNSALTSSPKVPSSPGSDWCDSASMDFSQRMDLLMAKVESPPNELQSFPATSTVPTCSRKSPPRELPTGSLRSEWKSCNQQATNFTTQYLSTSELGTRVDVSVYQAMGARAQCNKSDAVWCRDAHSRFVDVHKGYYYIPMNLKCDRALLEHPSDAIYVEQMCQYLFSGAETLPPICTGARLYEVTVSADKTTIQRHQLMWAILMIHHRVVSFEDFFVARRSAVDLSKVPVSKADSEPALSISWDIFPTVPQWLIEAVDLRSAHVIPIRALTFFAQTARQAGGKVYQKWSRSLQVELAIHVAVAYFTAWARPVIDQPRIWYPPVTMLTG